MGGQQSSRRLIIENDDSNNVIKVSEKVVERLKGSIEGNDKRSSNPAPPPRSMSANTVHIQPRAISDEVGSITSLDIKKQYEEELKNNNEYWEERIKNLQESHERINQTWDREYKKAIEDVDKSFPQFKGKDKKLPCQDQKTTVLNCYKKNNDKPLNCANEVQAFVNCMNNVIVETKTKGN